MCTGWTDSHLHWFVAGELVYSDPAFELDAFGDAVDPEAFVRERVNRRLEQARRGTRRG